MELRSYRAKSLNEALQLVREDLGPDAAVLHTREVQRGMLRWLTGGGQGQVEVTASSTVNVPSRFASEAPVEDVPAVANSTKHEPRLPAAHEDDYRTKFREDLEGQVVDLESLVEELCCGSAGQAADPLPDSLSQLWDELLEADVNEELARAFTERLRAGVLHGDIDDLVLLRARLARMIESEIRCSGPLDLSTGRKVVALVGPTGVGKTTTIAKLAANFHLRERRRVGLITVDTYRMGAVDQLRTYADIIDLPMEIVATPREMRTAVRRLSGLDLILVDTAGRSPQDELRIQELKAMLTEAQTDDVMLVLSSVASARSLEKAAACFAGVGVTSLLLTKLDEVTGLGNVLPLICQSGLPLSYVTDGQNVPDDIAPADCRRLARFVLGMEITR